jgi:hypothetical protein
MKETEDGIFVPRHKSFKIQKPDTVTGRIRIIQDDT